MVAVATAGCLLASDYLTSVYFHNADYYADHGWPKLTAFWVAAGIVQALVPRYEEAPAGASELFPSESALRERESVSRVQGTLFFIPVKYWPLILLGTGILFYFIP